MKSKKKEISFSTFEEMAKNGTLTNNDVVNMIKYLLEYPSIQFRDGTITSLIPNKKNRSEDEEYDIELINMIMKVISDPEKQEKLELYIHKLYNGDSIYNFYEELPIQ